MTIQQDGVSEGVEIFTASLSLLPGDIVVQIGDQAQATTTIRDSDGGFYMLVLCNPEFLPTSQKQLHLRLQ